MDEKFISLKEAAEISGYAPDYIGQLIRAGKITGKQVYTNVSWMTTEAAVLGYKNKSGQAIDAQADTGDFLGNFGRRIKLEIELLKQLSKTFKLFLPTISIFIISLFIFLLLLFSYLAGKGTAEVQQQPADKINNSITF
jgi:hypothetical protein